MIDNKYVTFETAKRIAKFGFDSECFAGYNKDGVLCTHCGFLCKEHGCDNNPDDIFFTKSLIDAPTIWLTEAWLRLEKGINIIINETYDSYLKYKYYIFFDGNRYISSPLGKIVCKELFTDKDDALTDAIDTCLTLLEENV